MGLILIMILAEGWLQGTANLSVTNHLGQGGTVASGALEAHVKNFWFHVGGVPPY